MNQSPRDLQIETISVKTTLPVTYRHRAVSKPRLLVIFLHGYTDHAGSFLKRLFGDTWPENFRDVAVLAPNGPFPVPVRADNTWREAYAWYFYDDRENLMILPPDAATTACLNLISKFGYEEIPKVLVGFSQGGYLAPHLAQQIKNVREIIGVGTGYREDYYPANEAKTWFVSAVHGSNDEIFPIAEAHKAHEQIKAKGFRGEFHEIAGLRHVASPDVGAIVSKRVQNWL